MSHTSDKVIVYKNRTNEISVLLNFDITGNTITSQIKTESGVLIATWTVSVLDASEGSILLTLDNSITSTITQKVGYMDLKRVAGGEPYAVFERPLEVEFRDTITS